MGKRKNKTQAPPTPALPLKGGGGPADEPIKEGASAWLPRLAPLCAALVTFAVFYPSLSNGWVTWDDADNLLNNKGYRGLGPVQLKWIFSGSFGFMGNYEPVTWLAHALTWRFSGLEPWGFHLAGLLLHSAAAAAFCALALKLLQRALPAEDDEPAWALPLGALFAALLFSLHPLRVEVAAWVSAQHHAMASVFLLLSALAYIEGWKAASVAAYGISLFCIPIGVTLPVALLLLDAYPLRRASKGWAALVLEKLPYWLLAGLAYALASSARRAVGDLQALGGGPSGSALWAAGYCALAYLKHLAWPLGLSPLYGKPEGLGGPNALTLGAAAAVAALTLALFAGRRRRPALWTAWAFYLAALAPALLMSQKFEQFTADRYTYYAGLGWALLGGGAFVLAARRPGPPRAAAAALTLALLAVLGALSRRQLWVWHDAHTIWEQVLALDPNMATAHNNLGAQLSFEGRKDEALEHFKKALAIEPNFVEARNNLGETLGERGQWGEALKAFQEALKVNPNNIRTRLNLGMELRRQGRLAESELHYGEALKLDPDSVEAHSGLGATLAMDKKYAEAEVQFQAALRVNPRAVKALNYWGNLLRLQGRLDAALERYAEAARINPRFADAQANLADTLRQLGRTSESIEHYEAALAAKPSDRGLAEKLAAALTAAGRRAEAEPLLRQLR